MAVTLYKISCCLASTQLVLAMPLYGTNPLHVWTCGTLHVLLLHMVDMPVCCSLLVCVIEENQHYSHIWEVLH